MKSATIGGTIVFGSFEQDNDTANGKEPIEWYVINKNNSSLLVISKYILDRQKFDTHYYTLRETFWESCSLRTWLNNDFFNNSFSQEEKSMIPATTIEVHKSPNNGKTFGNTTLDKVFLLSPQEVNQYLTKITIRTDATKFANRNAQDYETWWLRTNQGYEWSIYFVMYGDMSMGTFPDDSDTGVRPAMWINVN